jgi:hypothetical protein
MDTFFVTIQGLQISQSTPKENRSGFFVFGRKQAVESKMVLECCSTTETTSATVADEKETLICRKECSDIFITVTGTFPKILIGSEFFFLELKN